MIRLLRTIPLVTVFCLAAQLSAAAQDDSASLNKQIALLKQEIDLLKREVEILSKENASLKEQEIVRKGDQKVPGTVGEINGIIWEISGYGKSGKLLGTGRFLAANGKLYTKDKEVGVYSDKGDRSRCEVTGHDNPALNGTYNFLRRQIDPPSYEGTARNRQGQEFKVKLRIVQD